MRRNVEIKARSRSFPDQRDRAASLSGAPPEIIEQEDVFFGVTSGRLKLRKFSNGRGELIYYERPDEGGPAESNYILVPTTDTEACRELVARLFEVTGVVRKRRTLFLAGSTRIHLDEVEGLGEFVEIEAVLGDGESFSEGKSRLDVVASALGIESDDLIDVAYVDLIQATAGDRHDV